MTSRAVRATPAPDPAPSIAFVIATLNEQDHIGACVQSLLSQDYPKDRIEVAVVDGGSSDRTISILESIAARDSRLKVCHNPRRIAATAFNIGVHSTSAELVSLVSAHSVPAPDYAAALANAFDRDDVMLVGGRMRTVGGDSGVAQAISLATSSPIGVGSARFHFSDEPGWVDTAFPGAYRRELFDHIGGFDERLVRNQDDDLHFRARRAGFRMWYDPRLVTDYHARPSLKSLWRQYYEYGMWRAVTMRKHKGLASMRQAVPGIFVLGVVSGLVLAPWQRTLRRIWICALVVYGLLIAFASPFFDSAHRSVQARLLAPAAFVCLHFSYGLGFWRGLAHDPTRIPGEAVTGDSVED